MVGPQIICYQNLLMPVMTSNLCDTDATAFSDLVPGRQSPIHPPITTTDIINERELQYTGEYLLIPQYQRSGTATSTSTTKVIS